MWGSIQKYLVGTIIKYLESLVPKCNVVAVFCVISIMQSSTLMGPLNVDKSTFILIILYYFISMLYFLLTNTSICKIKFYSKYTFMKRTNSHVS